MAWYPGATKLELQPESDSQAAIRPTQFIVHSLAAPWTAKRTYEFWRDSSNLESHFGLGYEGDLGQFIGTETRADANAAANLRADGTGAVSLESASNLKATDPWTAAQVEELIKLGVWLHQAHGIPLRICRSASDPGFGYHRQFTAWNPNGHSCPGDARVKQFETVVFPGIVARATGTTPPEEDDMTDLTDTQLTAIARKVLTLDGVIDNPNPDTAPDNPFISLETAVRNIETVARRTEQKVDGLPAVALTAEQVAQIAAALAADPALTETLAETLADKLAARLTS